MRSYPGGRRRKVEAPTFDLIAEVIDYDLKLTNVHFRHLVLLQAFEAISGQPDLKGQPQSEQTRA